MAQTRDQALKDRAAKVIPGGMYGHLSMQLMAPNTPQYFERAKGGYVWDYDGNRYIDFMCGFGPNLLGYGHEEIDAAFVEQLKQIDAAVGPSAHMIELAEAYVDQITHADWAMFCKNGSDATTISLLTARAHRGRKKILLAAGAYHGASTWNTPLPAGTVPEDRANFIYYEYNNPDSLRAAADEAGEDLAGIFATPFKHEVFQEQLLPNPEYARAARQICDTKDAILVVDDVRAGFRLERDCSWRSLGVQPDLSSWGKSLANGHAISAVMGNERAREAAKQIFVTGSFWFAAAPMAAALKTLEIIQTSEYLERSIKLGERLRDGLASLADTAGVPLTQTGPAQMPLIMVTNDQGERDHFASQNFCAGLLQHGVYFHPYHNMFITAALSDADIDHTLDAAHSVLRTLPAQVAA
ncbi:MAG: aminotransferase class III-fold pyridoxal phosphate-dependent enzyme [Pseudomonadota bacterium]